MFSFVFWNLNRKRLPHLVGALALQERADVVVLCENTNSAPQLLDALNTSQDVYRFQYSPGQERINIFTRLPRGCIEELADEGTVAFRRVTLPAAYDILLVAAHLSSKMWMTNIDQALLCTRLRMSIVREEQSIGHTRTIVVGDLNMNPFEDGVVSSEGLHAVSTRARALNGFRTVQGEARHFFYNPCWSRLGEHSGRPAGSFHYTGNAPVCHFWNMFDQVLVRPQLLPYFQDDDFSVITSIGDTSLLNGRGEPRPDVSDHLPIRFRLRLE